MKFTSSLIRIFNFEFYKKIFKQKSFMLQIITLKWANTFTIN